MNTDFEQLGGFKKIEFFLLEETDNWPIVINSQTILQMIHSNSFLESFGTIADSSIDINIVPKQSIDGTIYPIEINFSFLNRTEQLQNYLDVFQNKQVVVIAELNTGAKKLYGTNEQPLLFNYKIDNGTKVEDLGIISVVIKGEMRDRPVYYNV